MSTRWTVSRIESLKGKAPFACLTAADACFARLLDDDGIPLILVGDSLATAVLGHPNTLPMTVDQMLHHTAAVVRGVRNALVVADMPFLSYQVSIEQAIVNAGRFLQEAGAQAVKIEGGAFRAPTIEALVRNGIPVLAHIGLTPQSVLALGGYKVQGRDDTQAEQLVHDACALETAGAFAVVIECVPPAVGERITGAVRIPTIGIGAGPHCDGQILVTHDLLGLTPDPLPRFAQRYARLADAAREAVSAFQKDVSDGTYPDTEHSYT